MALKNQPEFEAPETTTTNKDETMTTTATANQAAAAAVAATTAIAKAATTGTAVGPVATKLKLAFSDKNAVFDVSTVEGLSMAVPRVKGEQGSLFAGDVDLGAQIQFEIVSVSPRWVIGIGEESKESKDFFRVSYDNHTISGESTLIDDYIADLKAQGFEKARKSNYLDIFGFITWAEKKGTIAPDERELSCLQCSQTSLGAFTAFATTRGLLESRGVAQPLDIIEVHAEKRTSGSNKYTNMSFCVPKAK